MKVERLSWDTDFFEKNIGEVALNSVGKDISETEKFDLIVVKQRSKFPVTIEGFSCTFEETKVIFTKNLLQKTNDDFSAVRDSDNHPKDPSEFQNLAYESGKYSRFHLDHNFGEEKFKKLYDEWVVNSLNKTFAFKTFYIEEQDQVVAFVTVQKFGKTGKIGLIATHPEFQGKGYGKIMLKKAEECCILNGLDQMEIPTQKINTQACNFYKKLGYELKEELIIKHFWKKNDTI